MTLDILIDALGAQFGRLVARLVLATGARPSLAHLGDLVTHHVAEAMRTGGLGPRAVADIFDSTPRTLTRRRRQWTAGPARREHRRRTVRRQILDRLIAAEADGQATLPWSALDDLDAGPVRRTAVLAELIREGIVYRVGVGARGRIGLSRPPELLIERGADDPTVPEAMVVVALLRDEPTTVAALCRSTGLEAEVVEACLAALERDERVESVGRIRGEERVGAGARWRTVAPQVVDARGDGLPDGWQTALFDHFESVVTLMASRLGDMPAPPAPRAADGALSTYVFDVRSRDSEPIDLEASGLLSAVRRDASALRLRLDARNVERAHDVEDGEKIVFYAGRYRLTRDPMVPPDIRPPE